ncbi:MAG: glycine betaine/L-proline ABC transporter ATP-binding protein [Methanomicrobiales archaeon]|nr:glycine betaine/L-proline ABC transporter ATP-binding protein [Methanomicrobiales archaeon]
MEGKDTKFPKVQVTGLTKIFGQKPDQALALLHRGCSKQQIFEQTRANVGLNNVSFEVFPGEIFVLMGLSGCGKSTLLRCINRLVEPTTGEILIDSRNIVTMAPDELREMRRHTLGMIFQSFALLPHRSVLDNVAFGLEIQGMPESERHKRAEDALDLVGLSGHGQSMPGQLSGGMQQRVGLARALASDPDILLMDEAFSALDPLIRRDMQDELIDLQQRLQKTIIFVSHDLDEALKLGDRIALMKDGEIVQIGSAEEILTNPADSYVEKFVADVDMAKVLTACDVMKRPEPLIAEDSGPRNALRLMTEYGISSIFVVGKGRILKGLIMADDALGAKKENRALGEILIHDIPTVPPETPVADIIPLMAEARYPVAVVDGTGKIRGIIVRGSVLAALARMEVNPDDS